ncbi:MAG: DUF433 domain-containing protein [Anaerolineae bacterium]|nr:DUF433 domain-containing protein [Anaerolineae bacterium]
MADQTLTVDLSQYIDQHYFGIRPHIRGRRVPVATIAYNARANGWSVSDLAYNFGLTEAQVLSALLYYQQHQAEVDAIEAAYEAVSIDDWIKHGNDALLLRRDDVTSGSE